MKVLFDTCVVLDYLMDRKPFSNDAYELVKFVANDRFEGCLTVKTMMDIHYVIKNKLNDEAKTRKILKNLSELFDIVDSSAYCCLKAIESKITDYEDAMMSLTGETIGIDYFLTRNIKDYKKSTLNIKTPKEFLITLYTSTKE